MALAQGFQRLHFFPIIFAKGSITIVCRKRDCSSPAPTNAGFPCFGRSSESSQCPTSSRRNLLIDRFCSSNVFSKLRANLKLLDDQKVV